MALLLHGNLFADDGETIAEPSEIVDLDANIRQVKSSQKDEHEHR
jgi:hypothetical protein